MGKIQHWIIFAARLILGLAFIGSGLSKIGAWDATIKFLASTSIKQAVGSQLLPTVAVAMILIESVGGFFLCLGFRTRLAGGLLAAVLLLSLSFFHDIFTASGAIRTDAYLRFLLDSKVLAGLLFVACFGPGKYSVDRG
ncbi:Inner membrane protein YqjF [Chlamydiales bacterium SCGC AG-110-P3]|nr:Inner membrane protein YqjF [Chlamydiales bacterium SCGC AG-110-P3]